MNREQRKKLVEFLQEACGNSHSVLKEFLAFEFDDTGYNVNPNAPFKNEVFDFVREVERQNALEPQFALALQAYFSKSTKLVRVARDILIADPLVELAKVFDRAAD